MFDRGSPWNRQHYGRSPQKPSQRYLCGTRRMYLRDPMQYFTSDLAGAEREPGYKSNSILLTVVDYIVPLTIGKAIPVLHRNDGHNSARPLDVLLRHV